MFLLCVFTLFIFVIELNMLEINVSADYKKDAENQQTREYQINSGRGIITDANFNNITDTLVNYKTFITPYDTDLQAVFNALTEGEKSSFNDKIQLQQNFIANISYPLENRVYFETTQRYTDFNIAQHLIGYIDGEGNGISGIEKAFNSYLLNGSAVNYLKAEINGYGIVKNLSSESKINNLYGKEVVLSLTIDNTIQRICEGLAKEYIPNGSIVVMESDTGKIKAMVSTPFYSANNVGEALNQENSPLLNKALQSYECGSVIKPIWGGALIENGFDYTEEYYCDGSIEINGHEYSCANHTAHGMVDMEKALIVSCNGYFINAYLENKSEVLYYMANSLNFGKSLELADEYSTTSGYFPTSEEMNNLGQLASVSFGQGKMLLTPVHIAAAMNIFANEGRYVYPQVVQGLYYKDTKDEVINMYEYKSKEILSQATSQKIKEMLKLVVEEGALGRANPEYLSAGGKTGTAQTGKFNENGDEILNAWFCGFYPYENPKYTICITMYNGGESTKTAAPIFKKICDSIYYLI